MNTIDLLHAHHAAVGAALAASAAWKRNPNAKTLKARDEAWKKRDRLRREYALRVLGRKAGAQ